MKTVENADEQAVSKRLRKKVMTLKLLLGACVDPNETTPDRTAPLLMLFASSKGSEFRGHSEFRRNAPKCRCPPKC